jgi:hypothetical protein
MKCYLLTSILITVFTSTFAQDRHWHFGVKGGIGKSGIAVQKRSDYLSSDKYSQRTTYSAGARVSYQFLKYFAVAVDPEWQMLKDHRKSVYNSPVSEGTMPFTEVNFSTRLNRVQMPVGIQFSPWQGFVRPYVSAGVVPYYITGGNMNERTEHSSAAGRVYERDWKPEFSFEANKPDQKGMPFFAGVGIGLGKHVVLEVSRTFSGKMELELDDPNPTFRMPYLGHNYALKNTRLAVILQL